MTETPFVGLTIGDVCWTCLVLFVFVVVSLAGWVLCLATFFLGASCLGVIG